MKFSYNFKCVVNNGKLILENRKKFDKYVLKLKGEYNLSISKIKKDRSAEQNKYYWGVVINILCLEIGYNKDEMHSYIANKFLGFNKVVLDEEIRVVPTTTRLKTKEFEDYLQQVRMWASAELNCYIPLPNEISI